MYLLKRLEQRVWQAPSPTYRQRLLRMLLAVFRLTTQSRIKLFATSLTYHTLLAIVPLLAVLFTLLKSFRIDQFLQQIVNDILAPMGSAGQEVSHYLFQFIANAQAGVLGGVGLLFLLYTIFSLFRRIEVSLNHLWFIEQSRSLKNQLFSYLGVIMLTLVVATLALTLNVIVHQDVLTQLLGEYPLFSAVLTAAVKLLSLLVTALMLAVIYSGAINTEVNFRAALMGGLFCATLWLPLTAGFATLMAVSRSYSMIYSSFAGLIILLIWLNVLWLLFLSGGLVAYFVQFPTLLQPYSRVRLNPAEIEFYAEQLIATITTRFNQGLGVTDLDTLMQTSRLSHRQIQHLLAPFLQQGLLIILDNQGNHVNYRDGISGAKAGYLPAVNPKDLGVERVLQTVRGKVRRGH